MTARRITEEQARAHAEYWAQYAASGRYISPTERLVGDACADWLDLTRELAELRVQNERQAESLKHLDPKAYPHMCRDDHEQIGFSGDDELCPVCKRENTITSLRAQLAAARGMVDASPIRGLSKSDWLRDLFLDWWQKEGRLIDPDTSDVPWFDKRQGLAEYAFNAGIAFAERVGEINAPLLRAAARGRVDYEAAAKVLAGVCDQVEPQDPDNETPLWDRPWLERNARAIVDAALTAPQAEGQRGCVHSPPGAAPCAHCVPAPAPVEAEAGPWYRRDITRHGDAFVVYDVVSSLRLDADLKACEAAVRILNRLSRHARKPKRKGE